MKELQDKVLEIAEIAKKCPNNFQAICFELLLRHHLESISPTREKGPKSPDQKDGADTDDKRNGPDVGGISDTQDDISEKDIHAKVRRFIEKYGISIDHLNNLFYKEGESIAVLYEDLQTSRMAEGQIRIALLQSLRQALETGDFHTRVEDVRTESITRKCYDSPNFGKNFTKKATLFDFEKYSKDVDLIKLSEEGRKELAALIKELQ
jgi:hypothetical protein